MIRKNKILVIVFACLLTIALVASLVSCSFTNSSSGSKNATTQNKTEKNKVVDDKEEVAEEQAEDSEEAEEEEQEEQEESEEESEEEEPEEEEPEEEEPEEPVINEGLKTVYLGDSIAEAIYGVNPLAERENYGYYGVVGQINGYTYSNYAVGGYTTKDTYNVVANASGQCKTDLEEADIIVISAIGNDFLQLDYSKMLQILGDYMDKDYTSLYTVVDKAKNNIVRAIKKLRQYNQNATIIVQNLYNPLWEDSIYISQDIRNFVEGYGYTTRIIRPLVNVAIKKVNARFFGFLDEFENDDKVTTVDIYSAFNSIAKQSEERGKALIYKNDGIHPSSYGHAVIADTIHKRLVELKLAATNVDHLANYKALRLRLLDSVYYSDLDTSATADAIENAESIDEVTEAFFSLARNVSFGVLSYEEQDDGTLWVSDCIPSVSSVTIPTEYKGRAVTGICNYAFRHAYHMSSLYIPNTIEHMNGPILGGLYYLQSINCQAASTDVHWNEYWNLIEYDSWSKWATVNWEQ